MFREAKPSPTPLLAAEAAWTLTLAVPPSAAGAMDSDRLYIPLRKEMLVAIDRETGRLVWTRAIDTAAPVAVGGGSLFVVTGSTIHALDASTGDTRWSTPLEGTITAPLLSYGDWLIAIIEPGEVLALGAADGRLMWRRPVGAASSHPASASQATPAAPHALYLSLLDGRVVALALESGEPLWETKLPGILSPPAVGEDRVFIGSTDNFFYALDAESGREVWKWRNGGDVIGAAVDADIVYFASLDNMVRAVNRGNGNQRWRKPTGTRPVLPPRAFRGIVVMPGLMPAITVFVGETGAVMGTHAAKGDLAGPPLVDPAPKPFQVAFVTITREGVVEAFRPTAMMFRETAPVSMKVLPGRALGRERIDSTPNSPTPNTQP